MLLKYTLCSLCLLLVLVVPAQKNQKNNLPVSISETIKQDYPEAKDIDWKKKDSLFEVEFELGNPKKDHVLLYNAQGRSVFHRQDLVVDELPAPVLKGVRSNYPGFQIEEIEKVDDRGTLSYMVVVEKEGETWSLVLDPQGSILKKESH